MYVIQYSPSNRSIVDSKTNEMVPNVYVFCARVVITVLCQCNSGPIVGIENGR